ncbi:hypothetical protein HK096_011375, partial [Nowakowskiella sp. JEL0078]
MIAEVYRGLNKNCGKIEQMLEKVLRADQAKYTLVPSVTGAESNAESDLDCLTSKEE